MKVLLLIAFLLSPVGCIRVSNVKDPAVAGGNGAGGGGAGGGGGGGGGGGVQAITGDWYKPCSAMGSAGPGNTLYMQIITSLQGTNTNILIDTYLNDPSCSNTAAKVAKQEWVYGNTLDPNPYTVDDLYNVLGDPAATFTGTAIDITVLQRNMTAYGMFVAAFNGSNRCGFNNWAEGVTKDVLNAGCAGPNQFYTFFVVNSGKLIGGTYGPQCGQHIIQNKSATGETWVGLDADGDQIEETPLNSGIWLVNNHIGNIKAPGTPANGGYVVAASGTGTCDGTAANKRHTSIDPTSPQFLPYTAPAITACLPGATMCDSFTRVDGDLGALAFAGADIPNGTTYTIMDETGGGGTVRVLNGAAAPVPSSSAGSGVHALYNTGTANGRIRAKLTATGTNQAIGLVFRSDGTNQNFWAFSTINHTGLGWNQYFILKKLGGVDAFSFINVVPAVGQYLQVSYVGSRIVFEVLDTDGTTVLGSSTDTSGANSALTQIGILGSWFDGASGGNPIDARLDNFSFVP